MFDIYQDIYDPEGEDIDAEAFEKYIDGLMMEFAASPEAQPIIEQYGNRGYAVLMMEYAVDYLGVTLPTMTARDFREVVFSIIPRKVSMEASDAGAMVAELRAFWQFLQRAYALKNAASILALLKEDAAARLEKELANPANYGMAKSFVMMGQKLGFDMTTQEGMNDFLNYYNNQLAAGMMPQPLGGMAPGPVPYEDMDDSYDEDMSLPSPPSQTPKQRAEMRKKQRKAQRQARKRNRRKK